MYRMLRNLYYRSRWRPDVPSIEAVRDGLWSMPEENHPGPYTTVALCYCWGASLEEIARSQNVTRERIRQCLWKIYRYSLKKN